MVVDGRRRRRRKKDGSRRSQTRTVEGSCNAMIGTYESIGTLYIAVHPGSVPAAGPQMPVQYCGPLHHYDIGRSPSKAMLEIPTRYRQLASPPVSQAAGEGRRWQSVVKYYTNMSGGTSGAAGWAAGEGPRYATC